MFASFIPPAAQQLTDPEAIALLRLLRRYPIAIPGWGEPVATAAIRPEQSPNNPPLLLLHGFDSSLLEFRRLVSRLSDQPVYALDLLGAGFTACPRTVPVTPQTIRQHLYHSWQTLINCPVTLLGASLGGAVAIDFALAHPTCVARLVLVDSVGFSGSFTFGPWLGRPLLEWGADWLRWRKAVAVHALAALSGLGPVGDFGLRDLALCAALHQEMPGWQRGVVSFGQSGGYGDLAARISGVTQPTLILWGDGDTTLERGDAYRFKEAIADSRLVWIEGAGHVPHLEQPDAVVRTIWGFDN